MATALHPYYWKREYLQPAYNGVPVKDLIKDYTNRGFYLTQRMRYNLENAAKQGDKAKTRQHKYNYYTKMIREGYNTPNVLHAVRRETTFDPNDPQNQALYNRVKANSMKQQNIRTKRAKKANNKAINEEAKQSVNEAARNFFMEKEAEVNEMRRQKEEAARQEEEEKRKNKTFLGRMKKALTLKKKGGKRKTLRKRRNTTQRR